MKKIIFLCLAAIFSVRAFASPLPDPDLSGKILKLFHQDFPKVNNEKIYRDGETYLVYFKNEEDNSSCRVYYDSKGNILETFRYYSGTELAPFIRSRINEKYKGKEIFSVTEVTNSSEHFYHIILKDTKSLFLIRSDEKGSLQLLNKYKNA